MLKIIVAGVVLTIVALFAMTMIDPNNRTTDGVSGQPTQSVNADGTRDVEIDGEVNHPGVYGIETDSTLQDLIDSAGGITENADQDAYLPTYLVGSWTYFYIPALSVEVYEPVIKEKVNINNTSWDAVSLAKALSISESLAKSILDYIAANGPFRCLEELMNVKGIGQKTYEKLRELVVLR